MLIAIFSLLLCFRFRRLHNILWLFSFLLKNCQVASTRYQFYGNSFNKRKLVLAVIRHWVDENKPNNLSELLQAFPNEIRSGNLFVPIQEAKDIYERYSIYRHFLGDDEVLQFDDGTQYAISNQWGKGNIEKFITQVKKLGYEIEETD